MIDVEFDDRKFTGSHYGHLCRAQVRLDKVTIIDERDGSQNERSRKCRRIRRRRPRSPSCWPAEAPASLSSSRPANGIPSVVETVGDEMRVTIDGKPAGYLKSSGIAHATKSKIELGVAGKDGYFDDIKVWNAAAAK